MPANAVNDITFFNEQNFISASEKTSRSGIFVGVEGVIFYMYSDSQPGIYNIDIKVSSVVNSWFELAEDTIEAGVLAAVKIDFYVPEARIRFTPSSADTRFTAVAYGYPAVYKRRNRGDLI
jgi:hypothetical protein